jgi:hypothetical protein
MTLRQRIPSALTALALTFGLMVFPFATSAQAHGKCYKGVNLMERFGEDGDWHWYAHVPVGVQSDSWHVHGPRKPHLWPDSNRGRYVMVYFSWPHGVNPYLVYSASDWQACV